MQKTSAWRAARRCALLAFLEATEFGRRLAGRPGPYGVLKLHITGGLAEEQSEQRLLGVLRRPVDDYLSLITLLRWAREDPRLLGVLIRCESLDANWARLQGLRRGIERLRHAGKRVWAHLDGAGVHEYYLASAAERISLTPAATLDIAGLSSEAVFFFDALEKLGVRADVVQMGRYKSAGEIFTRREMSAAHREMVESLLDDLYGQLIDDVAAGRGIEPSAVRDLFDRGPFLAREALDARLVDELAYEDDVEAKLGAACGDAKSIGRREYVRRRVREVRREVVRDACGTLAVLHISGTIKGGESVPGPGGAKAAGARSIAAALKEARERDDVGAVVVRIASPGGSGVASDLIWRELVRTREKKPLVVSCGDVAASGGYYVAVGGEPVFAEPGTITGSIGVIAGKANLRGLYDRLGITKELVSRGKHAALYSDYAPLGEEERARIQTEAAHFYESFVEKVAAARHLSPDAVAAAAEGRVWTGRQAWTRGLVDQLGGLDEALEAAKTLMGVPAGAAVAVERFPRARRWWRLSLDLNWPPASRVAQWANLFSSVQFLSRERVWALWPFSVRFF